METLPSDELVSDCGTDFELESRPELIEAMSDPGTESDTSLFIPKPPERQVYTSRFLSIIFYTSRF